jgi:GST-like protein
MLKLYFHHTPNPLKVVLLLEELELPYQLVPVDMFKGEQHRPEYRAINPNGKVPALVDGDVTVFDSNAILLHLAEKSQRFLGKQAERPVLLSWLMFVATGLGPFSGQAVHFTRVHTDSAYATHRYLRELERHFSVLDARLARHPYLAGDTYTIADMAAWAWVDWSNRNKLVIADAEAWQRWPSLQRWFLGICERPAVERGRRAGRDMDLKTAFDEETMRALFPQNFAQSL